MLSSILNMKTKTISGAAILLACSFFVSTILGILRDRLLAGRFGAGTELDIYFAAFRIPDFIYAIFIAGGLIAVFLPIFSQYFEKDKEEAWRIASYLFNAVLVFMVLLSLILALSMSPLMKLITPGFTQDMRGMASSLATLMLLSPIILGISAVFSGVLQYFQRFFVYSLAPIMYNAGIIFGILVLEPKLGLVGLAFGVLIGAFLHAGIQFYPVLKAGFRWHFSLGFSHPALRQAFKLAAPRTLGAAAYNLNITLVTAIASTLAVGSIGILNFATNLHLFPVTLIGVSLGTAVFPVLSRDHAQGERGAFISHFASGFRQIVFFIVPTVLFMFLLRDQIISLLLKTGAFDMLAARLTGAALGIFSFGLLVQAFIPYLIRTFFALKDTVLPTVSGILSVGMNVVLALLLVKIFSFPNLAHDFVSSALGLQDVSDIRIVALPLALSLSSAFSFGMLLLFLKKKVGNIYPLEVLKSVQKILVAGTFLALAVLLFLQVGPVLFRGTTFLGILGETLGALILGSATYLLTLTFLKSQEVAALWHAIKRILGRSAPQNHEQH